MYLSIFLNKTTNFSILEVIPNQHHVSKILLPVTHPLAAFACTVLRNRALIALLKEYSIVE